MSTPSGVHFDRTSSTPTARAASSMTRNVEIPIDGSMTDPTPHSEIVRRTLDGVRWTIRREAADRLFGDGRPDWTDLATFPHATLVKCGHRRTTWRVSLPSGNVYAKVFQGHGPIDGLKTRLGQASPRREWHNALIAEARRVPIGRPLGVGARMHGRPVAIYVTESCGEQTLPEAWAAVSTAHADDGRRARTALIAAAARLLARAHQAGLSHRDGHPNNIVIHAGPNGPSAALIDLAWARFRRGPLDTLRSASSIAQLDLYFQRITSRTDRLRFVHAYYRSRHEDESDRAITDRPRVMLAAIADARERHRAKLGTSRDRRLRRGSTYFAELRLENGWAGLCALRPSRSHVFPLERCRERTEARWHDIITEITSKLDKSVVSGGVTTDHEDLRVDVDVPAGLSRRLAWSLWGSPQRRQFLATHARRHRNEPAPLIWAFLEQRRAGVVTAAVSVRNQEESQVEPTEAPPRP